MEQNESLCCEDLAAILAAWDTLVEVSQPLTDPELLKEEEAFDRVMEEIAVKNGHPRGTPRRRP